MTRRRVRGSAVLLAAVGAVATWSAPAAAHQDGCHRWHSCPSDTGSYVCGDLGYYSECPGGAPDAPPAAPAAPPVPVRTDYTPPGEPVLGPTTTRAGWVTVPVEAERGSRVTVSGKSGVVARATGTGSTESLRFRGTNGVQRYTVAATDSAGNDSDAASFTIRMDLRAPAPARVTVIAADDAYSDVEITGEPGATYTLRVLTRGRAVAGLGRSDVVGATGTASERLLVPNGAYTVTVALSDASGNATKAVTAPLRVALPAPRLTVERTGAPTSGIAEFDVAGPALGKGTVVLRAAGQQPVSMPFVLGETGTATVSAPLTDAAWRAEARVVDFQHRRATARTGTFVVDTTPPAITLSYDREAAAKSVLDVAVTTDAGSTATVTGAPGGPVRLATPGTHQVRVRADDGDYRVRVEATDAVGNVTTRDILVTVTHPATPAEIVTGLLLLLLMGAGLWFGGRGLWRRRWEWRAAAERRRLAREYQARVAQHQDVVARYARDRAAYDSAHAEWARGGRELDGLVNEAATFAGEPVALPSGVKPRPGEVGFAVEPNGGLVELRRPRGIDVPTVVEGGHVYVTSHRVVFHGAKRREWSFDKLVDRSHGHSGLTMMRVENRQQPSGVSYGGHVQFRLDLALAVSEGRRAELVAALRNRLAGHVAAQPRPPAAPPPPPPVPVPPTADLLRAQAAARRTAGSAWSPAGPSA